MLAQLRSEGFKIAVDDFGSGYSSMNSLTEFAFDIVKVDRALVSGHDGSARNIVVSHLIAMFTALKADVVIEGIETAETVEWLEGCPDLNVQGLLLPQAHVAGRAHGPARNLRKGCAPGVGQGFPPRHG